METFSENKLNHTFHNEKKDLKGLIFNIQKFSINDGEGIRTVVFFKGCPLRCAWCSNPESQRARPEQMRDDTHGGFTTVGEYMSVSEIMKVIRQDRDFYEESGGGVTFSGGEVLNQARFAIELAKAIKNEGIHLACETTGYTAPSLFKEFIKYMNFMFFDVKQWNSQKHHEGTGVNNELILQNLQTAVKAGKDLLVRIPVIPQFNDTLGDAIHFGELFNKVGIKKVELLPFHQFGLKKYDQLGREYMLKDVAQLHGEDLLDYKKMLNKAGIAVKLDGIWSPGTDSVAARETRD
ncbi:glycyl-radical enzyme activating protein [Sporolactobacillus sp. CQH2019]|uniref:glycyl-radical enzyme activating protein n=1 Tax=Sporolactobacillus sp. CQH2019 TaxID=3023512 RepID=UPI002367424A|nr:glycyl-radical enzyme activating protein [Sporolactobacillus sp. CQH2019]MDD9149629.1 glycyl-radical enzyme activating protein [Sporolactobacillus sp. CQH2019]